MIYGYARCSTNETKQDIDRQKRELRTLGAEEIYFEYESGTKIDRPELNKLLRHIRAGDTLVTTEISRITRSTKQLCEIIDFAVQSRIKLVIGTFVVDCAGEIDTMTMGMLKMMGVFAEMERDMTVDRIRSGMRNAKAKGIRLGRPNKSVEDLPGAVLKHFEAYKAGYVNKVGFAKLCGVSKPTAYKYIAILTDR